MADLSKIKLNGTTYNFKDAAAREELDGLSVVASTGDYTDLQNAPIALSDFDNDLGFMTSYTETDPTVPAWAKAVNKPTYTASEVGALPDSTTYVASFNGSTGAITYTAPVTSVNGQTGAVTLSIPSATTVSQVLTSGTLIATINGTNIYAPAYTDADGVSY